MVSAARAKTPFQPIDPHLMEFEFQGSAQRPIPSTTKAHSMGGAVGRRGMYVARRRKIPRSAIVCIRKGIHDTKIKNSMMTRRSTRGRRAQGFSMR